MNKFFHFSAVTGLLLAAAGLAPAATVVFDNTSSHPGGTLTFGTQTAPAAAVLSNGVIDLVSVINGSVGGYAVSSTGGFNCGSPMSGYGCVNFTTGSFISQTITSATSTYMYNAGGSLTINGMADGASGLLFSAAGFNSPVTLTVNNATGLASLSGSLAPGVLNSTLAAAFGLSPNTLGGTDTNSSINITFNSGTGSGAATTNSIQLTASAVPEPGSMALMASGLLGVAVVARRRMGARS